VNSCVQRKQNEILSLDCWVKSPHSHSASVYPNCKVSPHYRLIDCNCQDQQLGCHQDEYTLPMELFHEINRIIDG
jgi:hypothetical protein